VRFGGRGREVLGVRRDDGVRAAGHGGGEHVSVLGVVGHRVLDRGDVRFEDFRSGSACVDRLGHAVEDLVDLLSSLWRSDPDIGQ
jgi:hypothetical protein